VLKKIKSDVSMQVFARMCPVACDVYAVCVCVGRYAYPGDPPSRHSSHAGQRAGAVLLRLLHLRHRRRAVVGGATEEPLFHGRGCQDVSYHRNQADVTTREGEGRGGGEGD